MFIKDHRESVSQPPLFCLDFSLSSPPNLCFHKLLFHFILSIFLCLNPFSIRAARVSLTLFIICSLAPLAFAPTE